MFSLRGIRGVQTIFGFLIQSVFSLVSCKSDSEFYSLGACGKLDHSIFISDTNTSCSTSITSGNIWSSSSRLVELHSGDDVFQI